MAQQKREDLYMEVSYRNGAYHLNPAIVEEDDDEEEEDAIDDVLVSMVALHDAEKDNDDDYLDIADTAGDDTVCMHVPTWFVAHMAE